MSRLFAASTVSWQEGVVTGDCVGDGVCTVSALHIWPGGLSQSGVVLVAWD